MGKERTTVQGLASSRRGWGGGGPFSEWPWLPGVQQHLGLEGQAGATQGLAALDTAHRAVGAHAWAGASPAGGRLVAHLRGGVGRTAQMLGHQNH